MAPIKFEDEIREKLQERELQPGKDAWKKLSAQLGEEKKPNNKKLWFAIAASFIGILIVASFFFKNDNIFPKESPFVDNDFPSQEKELKKNSEEILPETNTLEIANEEVSSEKINQLNEVSENKNYKKTISEKNQKIATHQKTKITPNVIAKVKELTEENIPINKKSLVDTKIDEVVTSVKALQLKNNNVTPEEVDALLAIAQREIRVEKIFNPNTKKVDAAALLEDVEWELDRSFRDKVFYALGEGFDKLKSAVVERNNL